MEKKENPSDFDSCVNMIYMLSNKIYWKNKKKRPDVDYDDVVAEGMLIYSWCLKNYKHDKGMKFTTYLYQQLLGRLSYDLYNCHIKELKHYEDYNFTDSDGKVNSYEDSIISQNYNLTKNTEELLESAKDYLSYEALTVFRYIVSRRWENKQRHNEPAIGQITKATGFPRDVVDSSMGEIRQFWNDVGYKVA